jgi:hypothetical protein
MLIGLTTIIGTLVAENKLRSKLTDQVNEILEDINNNVQHKKKLISHIAWLTSWIGFLS